MELKFRLAANGEHYECIGIEPEDYTGPVTIPGEWEGLPVQLGTRAFVGCGVTSVHLPAGITRIPLSCFNGCRNLSEVTFEEGSRLERIDQSAFAWCTKGLRIRFPEASPQGMHEAGIREHRRSETEGCPCRPKAEPEGGRVPVKGALFRSSGSCCVQCRGGFRSPVTGAALQQRRRSGRVFCRLRGLRPVFGLYGIGGRLRGGIGRRRERRNKAGQRQQKMRGSGLSASRLSRFARCRKCQHNDAAQPCRKQSRSGHPSPFHVQGSVQPPEALPRRA